MVFILVGLLPRTTLPELLVLVLHNQQANLDVNGTVNVTGITTLGTVKISSGIVTATTGIVTYYGDGSNLTGIDAGIGTTGSVNTSGIITATSFSGDGSNLTGISAGIGTTGSVNTSGIITATEFVGGGSDLRNLSGTHLVSYASASDISNSALSISGISTYNEVGILTGTYANNAVDLFSESVATSADGKTIVVGAYRDEYPGSGAGSGVVYVYDRQGNYFNEVGILTGSNANNSDDYFGWSVATSADGKTIVVGARDDETSGSDTGVVYVFDRVGNNFNEVGILTGSNASDSDDQFGDRVATSADGKTIIVGARSDETSGSDTGVVYVFDRVGNNFNQVGILTGTYASDSGDSFGCSLANSADGKTIIVGARLDEYPGSGTSSGVVYVYDRQGNNFNQVGILTGSNAGSLTTLDIQ